MCNDRYTCTPLHYAASNCHDVALSLMLTSIDKHDAQHVASLPDSFGNTPLHEAVRNGHVASIKAILANVALPHQLTRLLNLQNKTVEMVASERYELIQFVSTGKQHVRKIRKLLYTTHEIWSYSI